jgi:transposase
MPSKSSSSPPDPKKQASAADSRPDTEVPARPRRRQFPAEYKLRILQEADACRSPGELGALLRREGLYSSHLAEWRRARREGALGALGRRRGPKGKPRDAASRENESLKREVERLRRRLEQAEAIIEIQRAHRATPPGVGARTAPPEPVRRIRPSGACSPGPSARGSCWS